MAALDVGSGQSGFLQQEDPGNQVWFPSRDYYSHMSLLRFQHLVLTEVHVFQTWRWILYPDLNLSGNTPSQAALASLTRTEVTDCKFLPDINITWILF